MPGSAADGTHREPRTINQRGIAEPCSVTRPLQQPRDRPPLKEVLAQRVLISSGPWPHSQSPGVPLHCQAMWYPNRSCCSPAAFPALGQSPSPVCPAPAVGPATPELQVQIHLLTNGSGGWTGEMCQPGCSSGAGTMAKAAAPRLVDHRVAQERWDFAPSGCRTTVRVRMRRHGDVDVVTALKCGSARGGCAGVRCSREGRRKDRRDQPCSSTPTPPHPPIMQIHRHSSEEVELQELPAAFWLPPACR